MSEKLSEANFYLKKELFADFFYCKLNFLFNLIKDKKIKNILNEDILSLENNKSEEDIFDYILSSEGTCFDHFVKDFLLKNKKNIFDFRKFKSKNYEDRILLTNFYFKNNFQKLINPVFKYQNFITESDYIEISHKNKTIKVYEIKSFSLKNDGTKEQNLQKNQLDLLFQKFVIEKATNYKVNYFGFYLPNKDFILKNKLNYHLIELVDFINTKDKKSNTLNPVSLFNYYLNLEKKHKFLTSEPNFNEDLYNFQEFKISNLDLKIPYFCNHCPKCSYFSFCQKKYLNDDKENIFKLSKLNFEKKLELFSENKRYIKDLTLDYFLNQKDKNKKIEGKNIAFTQYNLIFKNQDFFLDKEVLKEILKQYKNKIFMIDFETISLTVPQFKNTKPHNHVPFLYSIHIIDIDGKILDHKIHIENPDNFSLLNFIINFSQSLEFSLNNTYVAYYKSFEIKVCKLMEDYLNNEDSVKYEKEINILKNLIVKFVDLRDFFIPNKNYDHKIAYFARNFYGSTSIKFVLPSINNRFSYKNLKIQNGMDAMNIYRQFLPYYNDVIKKKPMSEWEKNKSDLLTYCGLDTLAMVEIYLFLKKLS